MSPAVRTSLVAALCTLSTAVAEAQYRRTLGARAWYESLRIAVSTPQARQAPATQAALRRPFDLTFDARGRIRTLRAPEFPAAFEGVTDLSHQFDDLLLRLPVVPLARGAAWSDTAVIETRPAAGGSMRTERFFSARVVRDTVIDGDPAWVIELLQRTTVNGTQPMKGQPLSVRTALSGSDSGTVVFSTASGRMLARQRTGRLAGTLTYEGGPQPTVIPMEQSYENSVTRVP